ncbi:septal ring lytic transglycosylase RlpA family protein [Variovorax sp. PAMC 28711]|uniref:septal ring lytic transglycosylase RlpA family protein n=1 Tax=Variovorax sp. PAMC 28711 TaxID=1795631 RepID=UPI00078DB006|nr:septal ring lytic transglycosylase RlpA family protein [Variovorax sp. PAMC 28711]AMM24869.1 hypothetical protein AX767_11255 [Variovorax sp. PAMC 28711]
MDRALVVAALGIALLLAGCASGPRSGRDGAPSHPPANVARVPDAEPRIEAIRSSGGTSKPYTVLGRSYAPIADDRPFRESGLASWYGSKFHAQSTASGEPYDMYAMTAAHKTLPLPSYVRVRNPANGREAIVRVNDRGPFHDDRVIDLSYAAAAKLDLLRGVAPVEIERITNEDIRTGAWRRPDNGTALADAAPSRVAPRGEALPFAEQSVAVPAAITTPVVAAPRAEVSELPAMTPLAAAPLPTAAPLAATSSAAEPPPGLATAGFWIQLGAFSQLDGALAFRQKVARGMPDLAPVLNVFSESNTHRVQAGPYASRDVARGTAEQVRNGLQLVPMVVERR